MMPARFFALAKMCSAARLESTSLTFSCTTSPTRNPAEKVALKKQDADERGRARILSTRAGPRSSASHPIPWTAGAPSDASATPMERAKTDGIPRKASQCSQLKYTTNYRQVKWKNSGDCTHLNVERTARLRARLPAQQRVQSPGKIAIPQNSPFFDSLAHINDKRQTSKTCSEVCRLRSVVCQVTAWSRVGR